jgi:hypothetical protein
MITKQQTNFFLGVWELAYVAFGDLFFDFFTPLF